MEQDHAKRTKIVDLKTQFNDLVYEFSDIEDNDEDENNEKSGISETELNEDLKKALEIGFERLNLMNELCLKTRCRLEFCDELLEVAEDLGAGIAKKCAKRDEIFFQPRREKIWGLQFFLKISKTDDINFLSHLQRCLC